MPLRRGGLRWVDAGPESVTYLREHPDERVLVHVARADHDGVPIPLRALGIAHVGQVAVLSGEPPADGGDGTLVLPRHGPAAHAYLLV